MIIASFVLFLLVFITIGALSALQSDRSSADYLLAGRNVSPSLAGISAMATNNSGYMFIGAIGYTYASGLESIWVMFAWMAGDFMASFFIHKKMRIVSQQRKSLSFGSMVATWGGQDFKKVRMLAGVITVLFLGAYAAAQFNASSKALYVVFGWDYGIGAIIGSVIVLIYCLAGGIRASIWTDAAQVVVMFMAMILMLVASNRGISVLPDWVVREVKYSSDYITRPLTKFGITRTLYAATRSNDFDNPFVEDLIRLAGQEAKTLLLSSRGDPRLGQHPPL